jgi:dTMP kinase
VPDRRGLFVVFEGVEGAGKSTQVQGLADRLRRRGVECRVVREPGGTEVGERIRETVLDPALGLEDETELLLMLAARAEFVRKIVEPALARGEVVLADRYELSTLAYQGLGRGLDLERVRKLNGFATGGLRPDATVLLLVDPEVGVARRGEAPGDRMELEGDDFHRRVADAYRQLARTEPGVIPVEGEASVEVVAQRIDSALAARWPDLFRSREGS